MLLNEILTHLTYGELSQVSIGQNEEGELNEESYRPLVSHINLGLIALYKRFPLNEGRVIVPLVPGQVSYPITGDVFKIERVYTDDDYELGLNDESDDYSCFTPSANLLRVHADIVAKDLSLDSRLLTDNLEVVYRASPTLLEVDGVGYIDPLSTDVELPYTHLEALLYFIASRVNNPIGMVNEFHAGNSWAAKYEMECQKLENQNLRIDQGSQNTRLERGGWV